MAGLDDAASELESIARHLRAAGEGELVRELQKAIRDGVRSVQDDIRAGLRPRLPDPYADVLDADLSFRVSQRTSERDPGVTLRATTTGKEAARRRLRRLDRGVLAHPFFGNRKKWYDQQVEPGWFTGPAEADAPRVRAEIEQALEDVSAKAVGKGHLI